MDGALVDPNAEASWERSPRDRGPAVRLLLFASVLTYAAAVRALPLVVPAGATATASFDEGVYVSAAGLLTDGHVPYRDFVFLHPPGILLLQAPFAAAAPSVLGWDDVLVLGRWLGVGVGLANTALIALVASRWCGRWAAVIAAALYASFGPAISIERHTLLEPYVNLATLAAAASWLKQDRARSDVRSVMAGGLAGFAAAIKLSGGVVLAAMAVTDPLTKLMRRRVLAITAAVVVFGLLCGPFAVQAGVTRITELLVGTQLARPGGDIPGGSVLGIRSRLRHMLTLGPLSVDALPDLARAAAFLMLIGAAAWAWTAGGRHGRFWAALLATTMAMVLVAPDYYEQYAVSVAPPMTVIVAAASVVAIRGAARRGVALGRALGVATVLALAAGITNAAWTEWDALPVRPIDPGDVIAQHSIPRGCVSADDNTLILAANALPAEDLTGRALADPFGEPLAIALARSEDAPTTAAALLSPPAQERIRAALANCPLVALRSAPAVHGRFTDATRAWFLSNHRRVATTDGFTVWERYGEK